MNKKQVNEVIQGAVSDFFHNHHYLLTKKKALLALADENPIRDEETVNEYLERLGRMIQ